MQIIYSMVSLVKNVNETDREFKILKEKLVFHIKKAETALKQYRKENHVLNFIADNLESRLRDANERLIVIQNLLSNSNQQNQGISLKDKIKLSLPFNNDRDKINQAIEDLRQATQEVLNSDFKVESVNTKRKIQNQQQPNIDAEITQLYEMGPTIQENNALDFVMGFTKNHSAQLKITTLGSEDILKLLCAQNKQVIVEKSYERNSKEQQVELFHLGRMNFKKEYKNLKAVYPDIDKISKLSHFRLVWKRNITHIETPSKQNENKNNLDTAPKKTEYGSQRKQQLQQFFSIPQGLPEQMINGTLILQKQKRLLYKKLNDKWTKIQDESFEVINGDQIAISLNEHFEAQLYFKVNYRFK